jgi:hypothetical protein
MGIHLDWEINDNGSVDKVGGENAAGPPASRRRALRIGLTVALVLAAGAAVVAVAIPRQLDQVDEQLATDLRTTVAAETAALRIGNREAFASIQSAGGAWRASQLQRFADYRSADSQVSATGDIVELEIIDTAARVVVIEEQDGQPYHVTWCYELVEGKGWRHAPSCAPLYGEQRIHSTDLLEVTYYERDEVVARGYAGVIDAWWAAACRLTACDAAPRLRVSVIPDATEDLGWQDETLVISTIVRKPAGSTELFSPELTGGIAAMLADTWAARTVDGLAHLNTIEQQWLRDQVRDMLLASFARSPGSPATVNLPAADRAAGPFLTAVMEYSGEQTAADVMRAIHEGSLIPDAVDSVLPRVPAGGLQVDALGDHLESWIRMESTLGDGVGPGWVHAVFQDEPTNEAYWARIDPFMSLLSWPVVNHRAIEVVDVTLRDDLLWATVAFRPELKPVPDSVRSGA